MDDPSLPDAFNFSILSSASSHVSRTSWAGSETRLFFSKGILLSKPIAPRASAACSVIKPKKKATIIKNWKGKEKH